MLPEIKQDVSLKDFSTMRLGGPAKYLCDIVSASQIGPDIDWAEDQGLPHVMIGGGSNIIWSDEGYAGLVMVNKIMGYDIQDNGEQKYLVIGAGQNWTM